MIGSCSALAVWRYGTGRRRALEVLA